MEENDLNFFLQKQSSNFEIYQIHPSILAVIDIKVILVKLVKVRVSVVNITLKSLLKTENVFRFLTTPFLIQY